MNEPKENRMASEEAMKAAVGISLFDAQDISTMRDWEIRVAQIIDDAMGSKWIKVEDGLPGAPIGESNAEPYEECLIIVGGGLVHAFFHYGVTTFYRVGDDHMDSPISPDEVTHWQPLPDPPDIEE